MGSWRWKAAASASWTSGGSARSSRAATRNDSRAGPFPATLLRGPFSIQGCASFRPIV
jgi:hypothetical protein